MHRGLITDSTSFRTNLFLRLGFALVRPPFSPLPLGQAIPNKHPHTVIPTPIPVFRKAAMEKANRKELGCLTLSCQSPPPWPSALLVDLEPVTLSLCLTHGSPSVFRKWVGPGTASVLQGF
ncbi:UNVERIFIED_CONTAM: hypothetical protein K2H54_012648 [Gekko kuhli]